MTKLFAADFARLLKNKPFHISMLLMLFMGVVFPVINYSNARINSDFAPLDANLFTYVIFIAISLSVFCSLFVGTDYSDGTIRNKLMIGHTRTAVYFANFAVCTVADVFMFCAYILPYLALGIPLLGFFEADIGYVIINALCAFLLSLAFISIFLFISMLDSNKATGAVVCILGVFFILFSGIFVESRLQEPETYSAYSYTDNLGTHKEIEEPNPNYISGKKREVYEFLYDFLPGCQAVRLSNMNAENPGIMAAYSALIMVTVTAAGVILFKKKDLK